MDDELKKINIPEEENEEVTDESDGNVLIQEGYCDYVLDKYGNWVPSF